VGVRLVPTFAKQDRSVRVTASRGAKRTSATITIVRRLALAIIVSLLTISASGVSSLVMAEPCIGSQPAGTDDGACPPTCVTCGCCAQAVEPVMVSVPSSPDLPVTDILVLLPSLPKTSPRDILHVPRVHLS
jgi:hypothetical protein